MEIIKLRLSVTNCYLINAGNKYILIDTGYENEWEVFNKRLKEAGVNLSGISHIILTHHHDDHCGLLNKITVENPGIHIVMSAPCRKLLLKGENDRTHGGGLINKRIKFLIRFKQFYISVILRKHVDKKGNLKFPPYYSRKNDIIITEETTLRKIGINLDGRIINTPGHTIDSISVAFDDGDCIVGDAAANFLNFAGTKNCVIFVTDIHEYYKSWEKIISLNVKRIFPSHGEPFKVEKLRRNIWKNKKSNMNAEK